MPVAYWGSDSNKLFLQLCIEEIREAILPSKHLTTRAWKNVNKRFHEVTGKDYAWKQHRSHWHVLRYEWRLYQSLKSMASGVGWKEQSGTITASDDWWTDKIAKDKRYRKFKYHGLPHYDLMEELFGGVVKTGQQAYTPNFGLPHPRPLSKQTAESQSVDAEVAENVLPEDRALPSPNDESVSSRSGDVTKGVKRKKPEGGEDRDTPSVKSNFNRLIPVFQNTPAPSSMQRHKSDIEAAVAVLKNLPGVARGSPMQMFGVHNIVHDSWRMAFMALEEEDLRLAFLKSEWENFNLML